eukprot:693742-Lingulodinium_polyedra.AAC.1
MRAPGRTRTQHLRHTIRFNALPITDPHLRSPKRPQMPGHPSLLHRRRPWVPLRAPKRAKHFRIRM